MEIKRKLSEGVKKEKELHFVRKQRKVSKGKKTFWYVQQKQTRVWEKREEPRGREN